jgi:hypothetical protein
MSGIDRNHRIGIGGMGGVSDMPTEGSIVRPVCTTGKKKSRRTGENSFVTGYSDTADHAARAGKFA